MRISESCIETGIRHRTWMKMDKLGNGKPFRSICIFDNYADNGSGAPKVKPVYEIVASILSATSTVCAIYATEKTSPEITRVIDKLNAEPHNYLMNLNYNGDILDTISEYIGKNVPSLENCTLISACLSEVAKIPRKNLWYPWCDKGWNEIFQQCC